MAKKKDQDEVKRKPKAKAVGAKAQETIIKQALPIESPANQWVRRRTMEGHLRRLEGQVDV